MIHRMGIIGCGHHAQHHAKHYASNFVTHGVWDPDCKAMEKIESEKKYASLEELIADTSIDAVMICSPDEFHLQQIEMALAAGKHVFCEKPLLVPGQEIARLEAAFDLAKEKKLVLSSCHPRRYDRPIVWVRELMPDLMRGFGKVVSFDFDFSYHKPSNEWKRARSLLLDHVNHEVDLMNFFFGIQGFDAWKLHDGFDHYDVVGKRDDGITFRFRGTRRLQEHVYPEWCRIRLESGEIVIDMAMGSIHVHNHNVKTVDTFSGVDIDYEGRLESVMADFGHRQIDFEGEGYLSRAEMLMNTEAGIILQNEGVQRINIRS